MIFKLRIYYQIACNQSRAEKNSIGNQSRPESRQESWSAGTESRIGSEPILFILLHLFIINKIKNVVDDDCMQQFLLYKKKFVSC